MLASHRLVPELSAAQERVAELVRRSAEPDPHFAEMLPDALTELQTLLDELATAHVELRQQHDQMLKISEGALINQERYRELFDFAPDGYIATDSEGHIQEANQPAGGMLGMEPRHLTGKALAAFIAHDDRPAFGDILTRLRQEKKVGRQEIRIRTSDGAVRPTALVAAVHHDRSAGVCWLLHDLTELKETQERMLHAQRLGAIGQTMAALSHECRNALQRIQSCLSMLALEVRDRPAAVKLVERTQKAQDDLRRLFDDIRDYAAPIRLDLRPCDLRAVWRSAWADLEALYNNRQVTFREPGEGLDLWCVADAPRLTQVFRNVLDNALAACTDPAEIAIDCATEELDGRPAIRVAVRDNGPGLTPEQKRRIFDVFYTTKTRGMGLGMAIAQRIVQAHGGRIEAGQQAGRGAEILITLPTGTP